MRACPHCGGEFSLNVVDCGFGNRYLKSGCCDVGLRKCPSPKTLLRSPNLSAEEKQYLQRIPPSGWISGRMASILVELEKKAAKVGVAV